jgi:hypothetical protein
MWLCGVAAAPSQIKASDISLGPVNNVAQVTTADTIFYQGATTGVEVSW